MGGRREEAGMVEAEEATDGASGGGGGAGGRGVYLVLRFFFCCAAPARRVKAGTGMWTSRCHVPVYTGRGDSTIEFCWKKAGARPVSTARLARKAEAQEMGGSFLTIYFACFGLKLIYW